MSIDKSENPGQMDPRNQPTNRPSTEPDGYNTPTADKMPTRSVTSVPPTNPYRFKKSIHTNSERILNPGMLIKVITDVIHVLHSQDNMTSEQPWYKLWLKWAHKGIDKPDITIQHLARIVGYKRKYKSIKEVGLFIFETIPVPAKYIYFARNTKQTEPILRHNMPELTTSQSVPRSYSSFHNVELVQELFPKSQIEEQVSTPKRSNNSSLDKNEGTKEKPSTPTVLDNNPFAVLGDQGVESILGSSVEELSDDSEAVDKHNKKDIRTLEEVQEDEEGEDINVTDTAILNIKEVEISYDKQYSELLESLTDHDKNENDEEDNMDVLDAYWNTKVNEIDKKVASALEMFNKIQHSNENESEKPTTLSHIRTRVKEDVDKHFKTTVHAFDVIQTNATADIKKEGQMIKDEISQHWKSKLEEFTSQTNVKFDRITKEMENQRAINTDITSNIIATVQNELDDRVEITTRNLFTDLYEAKEGEHREQRAADTELWKNMRTAMATAYDKLVKTNSIVLKNNNLIKKKLAAADITIARQESQVVKLEQQLSDVEQRAEERKTMIAFEIDQKMENEARIKIRHMVSGKYSEYMKEATQNMQHDVNEKMELQIENTLQSTIEKTM